MALRHPRKLIVSMGDPCDFDGFLSLILYSGVACADTLIIMNYPAVFNPSVSGIPESFTGQPYDSPNQFGKGFQWTTPNWQADLASLQKIVFKFIRSVWRPTDVSNKLFVVSGGVNELNPFAPGTFKDPGKVFESVLKDARVAEGDPVSEDSLPDIKNYEAVFVDMIGSVAFYDDGSDLHKWMQELLKSGKFKALHVMGGVRDDEIPQTLGAFRFKADDGVNRLSCATMNQLYAPYRTGKFLNDCKDNGVPIIVVTNNLIANVFIFNNYDDFLSAMKPILSLSNDLFHQAFEAFYGDTKTQKPWDVVASYSLIRDLMQLGFESTPSLLFLNPEYGITLVSKSESSGKDSTIQYAAQLEKKINLSSHLPDTMIDHYKAERELLRQNSEKLVFEKYSISTLDVTKKQLLDWLHKLQSHGGL